MAERKTVWSRNAKKKLYAILESSVRRDKGKTFAISLYKMISKGVKLLLKQPEAGLKTTEYPVRGLYVESYLILYEIVDTRIIIHTLSKNPVK